MNLIAHIPKFLLPQRSRKQGCNVYLCYTSLFSGIEQTSSIMLSIFYTITLRVNQHSLWKEQWCLAKWFLKSRQEKIASIIHTNSSPMVNEANGVLSEGIKAHSNSVENLQTTAGKGRCKPKIPPNHLLFILYTRDKLNIILILQMVS